MRDLDLPHKHSGVGAMVMIAQQSDWIPATKKTAAHIKHGCIVKIVELPGWAMP